MAIALDNRTSPLAAHSTVAKSARFSFARLLCLQDSSRRINSDVSLTYAQYEELKEDEVMAAGAAAVAAAIANAIKASGVVVRVTPAAFQTILRKLESPLVIYAEGGFFSTNYQYLVSYKGFAFFTKSPAPILLPTGVETIVAKKIWVPQ
jgi:hypothetical protein